MGKSHFVIIGAGHAGIGLATGLRKHGWPGRITLLSRESSPPYQRPPLSKQFSISNPAALHRPLADVRQLKSLGIELSLDSTVCQVDAASRTVSLSNGVVLPYGKLAVCTGSRPATIKGISANSGDVAYLDSIESAIDIQNKCIDSSRATVVGGGPVSLEMAASLSKLGLQVTVLNRGPRLMQRHCSEPYSPVFESEHRVHRVKVLNNCQITEIGKREHGYEIQTSAGTTIVSDFVVSGIGTIPNTALLGFMGDQVRTGIEVDIFCRSLVHDIFALGDCARYPFWNAPPLRLESLQAVKIQVDYLLSHICGTPPPTHEPFIFNTSQFGLRYYCLGNIKDYDRKECVWDESRQKGLSQYFRGERLVGAEVVNDLVKVRHARDLLTKTN